MPNYITCLTYSLHRISRKFVLQLKSFTKFKPWSKRRKPKKLFSDSNCLTSSFAAMEVTNQLKQVFEFFDSNGDGKISPYELSEVLLSLGHDKSVAAKEAEGMVREMDRDGDGFVDIDEFMNVVSIDKSSHLLGEEGDLMDAFRMFDADKNGFISAEELRRVLISLGCDNCNLGECQEMIRGVDKDGDGLVGFEEFRSMMRD